MHPKLASGIFIFLYSFFIGGLISLIFKIIVFDYIIFYIIGVILDIIIYEWFAQRYDGDDCV